MRYSLNKKRLSLAKYIPQPQTPTPRSSLPFALTRTKKINYSALESRSQRYHTQPSMYHQDKYISNINEIKKLTQQYRRMSDRKAKVANPEYYVNIEQDILTWQESISVIKQEIQALRKEGKVRIKKVDLRQKKERELFKSIQEQIKNRNVLNDKVQACQKQIEYYQQKNQSLKQQIQMIQSRQSNTAYLNKLKSISIIQQQSVSIMNKLQGKYISIQQQVRQIEYKNYECDNQLLQCESQLHQSMVRLNMLTLQLYDSNQKQQISQIDQEEEEEEDENQFL